MLWLNLITGSCVCNGIVYLESGDVESVNPFVIGDVWCNEMCCYSSCSIVI